MSKYIKYIPKPFLDDLANNRVVPMIGAGFSKNATKDSSFVIPDWTQLGIEISKSIDGYTYTNSLDSLSVYETEFTRVKLIEILAKLLHVHEIHPSKAHHSLCSLFLDTICTTNFDYLIEHTLIELKQPHSVIIAEESLAIKSHKETKLIKLHGDFNHPSNMVITEKDYDLFIEKNKLLSTYISNLFITNTLFLVGYSFDDYDTRSLWGLISNRLGALHQPAYTILVDGSLYDVKRFERRNVKVINIPGKKSDYSTILNEVFKEMKEYIDSNKHSLFTITNEKVKEEIQISSHSNRLCFISTTFRNLAYIKELISPALNANSITPISFDELLSPGDFWLRKIEYLINQASIAIVDISESNNNIKWELEMLKNQDKRIVLISKNRNISSYSDSNLNVLYYDQDLDNEIFISKLSAEIKHLMNEYDIKDEPNRLYNKQEYNAAVISAFRLLENILKQKTESIAPGYLTLSQIIKVSKANVSESSREQLIKSLAIRNRIVHGNERVDKKTARQILDLVYEFVD